MTRLNIDDSTPAVTQLISTPVACGASVCVLCVKAESPSKRQPKTSIISHPEKKTCEKLQI